MHGKGHLRSVPDGAPFGALVAAAGDDPEAALALAGAYARVPREAREALLAAVIGDAAEEGVSALGALAALLSVEDDADVAARIRDAMLEGHRPAERVNPSTAWLAQGGQGGACGGAVVLVRPLYGPFVDVVAIAYSEDRVTQTIIEPLVRADTLDRVLAGLPDGLTLEPAIFEDARDLLVDTVWTHLRRGGDALPVGLAAHV